MQKSRILLWIVCAALVCGLCGCVNDREGVPNPAQSQPGSSQNSSDSTGESASLPAEQSTVIQVPDPQTLGKIVRGAPDENSPSGLSPLEPMQYDVSDPENRRGLSTAKLAHSHGPASGGKAHHTVEAFQDTFDRFGALTLDRTSSGKVLYLTFDCGWEYENLTSRILDTLKEKQVPAAFFCTLDHMQKQPELIARMIKEGHIVGNHSATHPSFPSLSRTQMVREIADTENYLRQNFGYCAGFFRFPSGEYSESALDLVQSMGYRSVFWSVAYNDWDVKNVQGAAVARKTVVDRLHPGAVILLHAVSKDNADALGSIIDDARSMGYSFCALSEYSA